MAADSLTLAVEPEGADSDQRALNAVGLAGNFPLTFWFALISFSVIPRTFLVHFLIQAPREFFEEELRAPASSTRY